MEKEDVENILERIHEWTKSIDQKVSIFLAFQGIGLTLFFPEVFSWIKRYGPNFSYALSILFVVSVVLLGESIYKCIAVIIPRLKNQKGHKSITYFRDITEFKLEEYRKKLLGISEEEYKNELINQTHISAIIAKKKYEQFRDSIIFFSLGVGLLIVMFLIQKFYLIN